MQQILAVTDELRACVRDQFEPYEGVYRINDFGEYVSEEDWFNTWAAYPPSGGCTRGSWPTTVSTHPRR